MEPLIFLLSIFAMLPRSVAGDTITLTPPTSAAAYVDFGLSVTTDSTLTSLTLTATDSSSAAIKVNGEFSHVVTIASTSTSTITIWVGTLGTITIIGSLSDSVQGSTTVTVKNEILTISSITQSTNIFKVVVQLTNPIPTTPVQDTSDRYKGPVSLYLSPGGEVTGMTPTDLSGGEVTFNIAVSSAGTFNIIAMSPMTIPVVSSLAYSVTNSISQIIVTPSVTTIQSTVSFTVDFKLLGQDNAVFTGSYSCSLTEDTGSTVSVATSPVTTGLQFTSVSMSTTGLKVLVVTCGSATGYGYITVTSSSTVTLSYSGSLVINSPIVFTSLLYDDTNFLVLTSQSGSISSTNLVETLAGTLSGTSSTGIISYSGYFTATGSRSVSVTHGTATNSKTISISLNIAEVTLSQDWGLEGGTLTYTIYLQYAPYNDEVITISANTAGQFTISPTSLTFTSSNYATAQTVTLTILETSATQSSWTSIITHTNSDLTFASCSKAVASNGQFSVTIYKYSTGHIYISSSPVLLEGGTTTFSVSLSVAPTATVTITLSSQSSLTLTSTLTYTAAAWASQSVTVTSAISSTNELGTNVYPITFSVSSTDNNYAKADTIPAIIYAYVVKYTDPSVLISENVVFLESAGGSYSIVLTTQPTSDVTVSLSTTGTTISFTPMVLIFTSLNYNTPQKVALSAVVGNTPRYLKYYITILHTVSSGDSNYNGVVPLPSSSVTVTAVNPCKAGMYAWPPGSGTCQPCPQGYSCPVLYENSVACSSTQYSPLGVWNCMPCPAGHSCNGIDMPVRCPDGKTSSDGVGVCSACTSNSCDLNGVMVISAPQGYYIVNNAHSIYQCPPGYYCTGGSSQPVSCNSGYYAPIGSSSCTQCPASYYCPDKATPIPILCEFHHYSVAGSTKCTYCPVGSSCTSTTATACTGSTFSLEGWMECISTSSSTGFTICAVGSYNKNGVCTTCEAGYECGDGILMRACAPGFYSATTGASACSYCSTGTYQNLPLQTSCTTASSGYIVNLPYLGQFPCYRGTMPNPAKNACISCTAGSQCDVPSTVTACVAGYFCSPIGLFQSSASNQQPCPSGYYNPNAGKADLSDCSPCQAGKFCPKASIAGTACPTGHYCPKYSYIPDNFPCPVGTYNTATSSTSSAACTQCDVGYYCIQGASMKHQCVDGTYCPIGSYYSTWCAAGTTAPPNSNSATACVACAAGSYCPPASFSILCPMGTYNPTASGGFRWDACQPCTAGHSCSSLGQTAGDTYTCSQGYYCPKGTQFADQYPCPPGTFSVSIALTSSANCDPCPQGYYCTIGSNLKRQVLCPRGNYCLVSTGYSHTYPCPAGSYVWEIGSTSSGNCLPCPSGSYCVRGASYTSGYCSPGYYCPTSTTLPTSNACAAGTYNSLYNATSSANCIDCPAGYYCLAGSAYPAPCPPGTYSSSTKTTSYSACTSCSAGHYCPSGSSSLTVCPDGYYAAIGSSFCVLCAAGSYCASGVSTSCSSGTYCPKGSASAVTCPAGYYCLSSASQPTPCPAGTSYSGTGANSLSACTSNGIGYYSTTGSSSVTGQCEPGYYCPGTSSGPYDTPCTAGTYNNAPGGTSSSSCAACPAGYYCQLGTAFPIICPVGYYCVASTITPVFCPSGYVGSTTGLQSSSACTKCASGTFCTQPGLSVPDGYCVEGYICTAGSSTSTGGSSSCPAGGYCQPGFPGQRPCPPGTYNINTGAKDITKCTSCDAGYYCYGSETVKYQNPCTAGYYCPVKSYWAKMQITSPGYQSSSASGSQTQCSSGTYNNLYAQSTCATCPAGFYCDQNQMTTPTICPIGSYCTSGVNTYTSCPAGTFSNTLGLAASSQCFYCTPGMYCVSAGLSAPTTTCDPGYYCTTGASTNKPVDTNTANAIFGGCPAGSYCVQGSPVPVSCPTGTFLSSRLGIASSSCTPCTAGYYCTNTGSTATQGQCDPGYYCLTYASVGTTVPRPTVVGSELNYCAAGKYCPLGSSEATQCAGGTYQDQLRQSSCNACPAGYYCPPGTGDYTTNLCPTGSYCPASTTYGTQYPCPQGTYNPNTGLTDVSQCLQCTPGSYCGTTGLSAVSGSCSSGYFCKIGSKYINPQLDYPGDSNGGRCVLGYYCPLGSAIALECDGGSYCNDYLLSAPAGSCSPGYYCIGKSSSANPTDGVTGNICPAGFYCPSGSISPTVCPKGTYNGSTGKSTLADCLSCPPGKYCGGVGLSTPSGYCNNGYYCAGGNYEAMPLAGQCTAGNYCPSGTSALNPCTAGSYQDQTLQSACKSCPAGYYCPTDACTLPLLCTAGNYCPTQSSLPIPCPAGTFSSALGRSSPNDCVNCRPGYYCLGGKTVADGQCTAGYYCSAGSTSSTPNIDAQGGKCTKGSYCPAGSTSPIPCTPGYYCSTTALTTYSGPCDAGFYCIQGATVSNPRDGITGAICPSGYYCPQGSSYPTPCGIGYYQPIQSAVDSSNCLICTAGYYCSSQAASALTGLCYAGYYCPQGSKSGNNINNICLPGYSCPTNSAAPVVCPDGTYQDQKGQSTCKTCPAGFYCDQGTTGCISPVVCPVGNVCASGTSSSTLVPCGLGLYNPFLGQVTCLTCPQGYYCGSGAITVPVICPAGSYCVSGTSSATVYCPAGTWTDKTGLQNSAECMPCPVGWYCTNGVKTGQCSAGYYCVSGSNTPTPDSYTNTGTGSPCPEGHYCIQGCTLPTPCPSGKFRQSTGGQTADDCSYCSAGYYCITNNPIPVSCPTGAFCPEGSSTPQLCQPGYYSSAVNAASNSTCTVCPAGYVCNQAGIGDYTNYPCVPGYYCPEKALVPVRAPQGFYSPGSTAGSLADLLKCPGGFYCKQNETIYSYCIIGTYCGVQSSSPTLCPPGYYCDYQSTTYTPCPNGWYCQHYVYPMTEYPPLLCPEGTVCVGSNGAGSIVPNKCNSGNYAIMARGVESGASNYCKVCSVGTYSYAGSTGCTYCDAGYICLGGSTVPNPTSVTLYNGYQCGSGYYCPSGIDKPIPCPLGTYSIALTLGSISQCTLCPSGTYGNKTASTQCYNCSLSNSPTSTSQPGSSTCTCIGKNRLYWQTKNICVCQSGYQFIDSNGNDMSLKDSDQDCTPIVYTRCATGQTYDVVPKCVDANDCQAVCCGPGICPTGQTYDMVLECVDANDCQAVCDGPGIRGSAGICQCTKVQSLNSICTSSCVAESLYYTSDPGGFIISTNLTTGVQNYIYPSSNPTFRGTIGCTKAKCNMIPLDHNGLKYFGVYGSYEKVRRRLSESDNKKITDPVVCIVQGDSMMFNITPDHYPVYMSQSLINSNKNFDYSAFITLGEEIKAGDDITLFAFIFNTPGIYLFTDYGNVNSRIIVGVMDNSTQCPFNGANIQPRTSSSLSLIGAKLDTNIVLNIDWWVVYTVIGVLVLSIFLFACLFYYFTLVAWSISSLGQIKYRQENWTLDIKGDEGTRTSAKMVIEGKEASSSASEADEIGKMISEKVPEQASYEIGSEKDEKSIIDSALLQAIKDKIRENNTMFIKFLEDNEQDSINRMKRLEDETLELRNLLRSLLDPLNLISGKPIKQYTKEVPTESVSGVQIQDTDYQEALNEIADNSELLEQDKQKLMNELNSELNKLNQNLKLEKSKHDEDLKKKLAARAQKRKDLERRRQELEIEEKQMIKKQQNEIWQIAEIIENDEKQLNNEINDMKFYMAVQVHGQQADYLQMRLREGLAINPHKQEELMREYDLEIQALEKNLTIIQIKQQQDIVRKIEERKKQRKIMMREKEAKLNAELELKHSLEQEEFRKKKIEIEAQEVIASVMPLVSETPDDADLIELQNKQKEELLIAEKELKNQEEQEVSKVIRNTSLNDTKISQQKAALEKQKKQLMQSMGTATEEEREELLKDIAKTDSKLKEINEQHSLEQKKNLDAKLEIRRQKREEKLKEIKDKQEKEKKIAEEEILNKIKEEKASQLDQAIKEAMSKLPEDQKDKAIQEMLEEKHEQERSELQTKLKRKLRDRQRNAIQEVMRMKANDLEILRNEYREKLKSAGRDSEISSQIQKEEAEALNKLDYYYMKKLESLQEEAWRDQQKKNQDELLALIDVQLGEMRKHMRKQDPHSEELENKLKKEREDIEAEGQEKLELLAKQKKELEELKAQKQKEIEDLIRKEQLREEKERQMREILEKKRSLIEKQKKEREELLKKGQLTKEQMEKLITEHQRELNALETAIARERERQVGIMSQKLAEKKSKKKEYEASMLKMKEEQERWQKELEELPGISNKQATTLLLKWRRYPKKTIKDIEKSVKSNEPTQKILPVVVKSQPVPIKKISDSRLEELMWRVEKIESTIDHVDSKQLTDVIKNIESIENKLKQIKK